MDDVQDARIKVVVIACKDRLAEFGSGFLLHVSGRPGGEIMIVSQHSVSSERGLVEGLLAIVQTFSYRICGLRKYCKVLEQALPAGVSR